MPPISTRDQSRPPSHRFKFGLRDIFLVFFGVAIGSAAGHWLDFDDVIELIGLAIVLSFGIGFVYPISGKTQLRIWILLLVAYGSSLFAGVIRRM